MSSVGSYKLADHIHLGEIDGYGYAFVPGSASGVVLLDLTTKELLEELAIGHANLDGTRIDQLIKVGLVLPATDQSVLPRLDRGRIRSFSTWLHITNACNLNCPYCYIANKGDRRHMSFPVMEAYLDKLEETVAKHNLKKVVIRMAGGEPTLHSKMIRYLVTKAKERLTKRGIQVVLVMLTNGTLLTEEWLRLISDHGIKLSVSLDGTREWHDKLRFFKGGRGTFDLVMRSLGLCRKFDLRPGVLSTITEANLADLQAFGRFLIDLDLPFRFGVYRDNSGEYAGYNNFIAKLKPELDMFYGYYAEAIRSGRARFRHQLSDLHLDQRAHLRSCNVGFSGVSVNHAGDVFLCQAGMGRGSIGNLWDGRTLLEMAWQQKVMPELSSTTVLEYPDCRECQWAQVCGGGCPLVNSSANGSATTSSPYCELFRTMIPKLIELKALDLIRKIKEGTKKK